VSPCPRLPAVVVLSQRAARRTSPTALVSSPSRCALSIARRPAGGDERDQLTRPG